MSKNPLVHLVQKAVGIKGTSSGCCGPTQSAQDSSCCGTEQPPANSSCCGNGAPAETKSGGTCCG